MVAKASSHARNNRFGQGIDDDDDDYGDDDDDDDDDDDGN